VSFEAGEILKLWAAPKYIFSRTTLDERLVDAAEQITGRTGMDVRLPAEVLQHFVGASVGVGLGFRHVHLLAELTAGYTHCRPVVFGRRRDLGGLTLYPAAALGVSF
jgi:hypothetical protein